MNTGPGSSRRRTSYRPRRRRTLTESRVTAVLVCRSESDMYLFLPDALRLSRRSIYRKAVATAVPCSLSPGRPQKKMHNMLRDDDYHSRGLRPAPGRRLRLRRAADQSESQGRRARPERRAGDERRAKVARWREVHGEARRRNRRGGGGGERRLCDSRSD